MVGIGIDIGSTAAKAAVVETDNAIAWTCVMPTGYSSVDAAERLRGELAAAGYDVTGDDVRVIATGYGRVAVPYANKVVTEITCHGAGAVRRAHQDQQHVHGVCRKRGHQPDRSR